MQEETGAQLKDTTGSKYKVGQVWKYKTRPAEPNSTFTVLKVEHWPKTGIIVHLRVDDVRIPIVSQDTISRTVDHMPFSEEAVDSSAVVLIKSLPQVPDYSEGYELWKDAFLAGKAGVFSIGVAESVNYMEQTINQGNDIEE